ncbi:MAG: tripartite tricarboxylate transporter permease, partial [bacterium]
LAVSLLIPFTFNLTPSQSLLLLTTIYCSTVYGGSISAILLRIPGSYESVATTFDGYPLAKQGKAAKALGVALLASGIGGTFSVIVMILMAPQLAKVALVFGPAEYFALGVLGLSVITSFDTKSLPKSLAAAFLGMLLATVGIDSITGVSRFDFGSMALKNGISFVPAIIGLFAVSEVLTQVQRSTQVEKLASTQKIASELPSRSELKGLSGVIARSSIIGTLIGVLPGVGGTVASLLSYSEAVRTSKHPEKYGTGILEGVAAPEAANNAACGGAMIPLLSLGIPGSAVTAVLVGAFMIHGLRPGPLLFVNNIDLVYTIFIGMFVANFLILAVGIYGIKPVVKMLDVPYKYMAPVILVLCVVGSYAINNNLADVWMMAGFGLLGYIMSKHSFPLAPLILGLVLGPITEISFRRALVMSQGNLIPIITRPIVAVLLIASLVSLIYPLVRSYRASKTVKTEVGAV